MEARFVLFCLLAAVVGAASSPKVALHSDPPSLRLYVSQHAVLQCCYFNKTAVETVWNQILTNVSKSILNNPEDGIKVENKVKDGKTCSYLTISNVVVNDTGLYQCVLTQSESTLPSVYTPGTYLQIYEPIRMTLAISESSKNSIITAQGILLLMFVLIPGIMLICKSKDMNELEKKKNREEENIYEGLNLDDCNSTYHQIQRSLVQGPYQDVINGDEDDIQLEKP